MCIYRCTVNVSVRENILPLRYLGSCRSSPPHLIFFFDCGHFFQNVFHQVNYF